jgi:hypothetical protein
MWLVHFLSMISIVVLTGCLPQSNIISPNGSSSRYSIDSYQENTSLTTDLSGMWMVIHNGTLKETADGVDYTVTGSIRELVEISQSGGVFYVRTCLSPEARNALTVSGNNVSMLLNAEQAILTRSGFTVMSGTASHSASATNYSGTVKMKKIAALNTTLGSFSFLNSGLGKDTLAANCLQEGSLHVVGKKSLFSKWADIEIGNVTDWSAGTYHQTGYMYSVAGTADPVQKLRFTDGVVGSPGAVREYPLSGETVAVTVSNTGPSAYVSSLSVESVIAGGVNLDLQWGVANEGVISAVPASSVSLPANSTPSASLDFLSMIGWMAGLFKITLPW